MPARPPPVGRRRPAGPLLHRTRVPPHPLTGIPAHPIPPGRPAAAARHLPTTGRPHMTATLLLPRAADGSRGRIRRRSVRPRHTTPTDGSPRCIRRVPCPHRAAPKSPQKRKRVPPTSSSAYWAACARSPSSPCPSFSPWRGTAASTALPPAAAEPAAPIPPSTTATPPNSRSTNSMRTRKGFPPGISSRKTWNPQ